MKSFINGSLCGFALFVFAVPYAQQTYRAVYGDQFREPENGPQYALLCMYRLVQLFVMIFHLFCIIHAVDFKIQCFSIYVCRFCIYCSITMSFPPQKWIQNGLLSGQSHTAGWPWRGTSPPFLPTARLYLFTTKIRPRNPPRHPVTQLPRYGAIPSTPHPPRSPPPRRNKNVAVTM